MEAQMYCMYNYEQLLATLNQQNAIIHIIHNNSIEFRFIINATIYTVVQVSLTVTSLRASSPIWASEMSLARTRPDLATTHHFPPFVPPSGLITQTKYFRKELAKQL